MRQVLCILSVCVAAAIASVAAANTGFSLAGPSSEGRASLTAVRYYVRYFDGQPRRQYVKGPYSVEVAERVARDLRRAGYRDAEVFYVRD